MTTSVKQQPQSITDRFKQRDAARDAERAKLAAREVGGKPATADEVEALGLTAEQFEELVSTERTRQRCLPRAQALGANLETLAEVLRDSDDMEARHRVERAAMDDKLEAATAPVHDGKSARDWLLRHPPHHIRAARGKVVGQIGRIERELRRRGPKPGRDSGVVWVDNEWATARATDENRRALELFQERVADDEAHRAELRAELSILRWKRDRLKQLALEATATQADVDRVLSAVPTAADLEPFGDGQSDDADEGYDDDQED